MAITHKYTLVCDDIRIENNGKLMLIGIYLPDVVVQQIPFVLPTLTFVQSLESDTAGRFQFKWMLQHLESGNVVVQGVGLATFHVPGMGIAAIKTSNVQFPRDGSYSYAVIFDDGQTLTHHFSVRLNIPKRAGQP